MMLLELLDLTLFQSPVTAKIQLKVVLFLEMKLSLMSSTLKAVQKKGCLSF